MVRGGEKTKPIQSQFPAGELFREKNLLFKFLGSFRYIFDGKY